MKTLHAIQPPIPEDLLLAATGLVSHFPNADLRFEIINNELLYGFGTQPTTNLGDQDYWAAAGRLASQEQRERAKALI